MDLEYILKGLPRTCTFSIIEMTSHGPRCLCSCTKTYSPSKKYEVLSFDKCVIGSTVDYFIKVMEIL